MVTFALPGDGDAAAPNAATPRSRPPLPFAKRAFAASPFGGSAKRVGTPHSSSARKPLLRDEPASHLSRSNIVSARNIFRASTISDSPPSTLFSPSIPASTPKKVFAPGATPEPSRTYRGSNAQATPRGVAARAKDKDLFTMRIASPPKELTGETLARKVPKDWNPKGSIYADQFLSDLCPPEFDDEQRRQFFCILDLRRLKYAADEIFARKDWKLNVINFAKEFEKSRSIILLRYGLYEFQNVKPSKEVLKRWRREHGLPEPEEDDSEATPTKPQSSKKRKADEESAAAPLSSKAKRRVPDRDSDEPAEAIVAPAPASATPKNKRKASVSEEGGQPSKISKPSQASSLFQKIANKSMSSSQPATGAETSSGSKPNPFAAANPAASNLARSVFSSSKPSSDQPATNGNIFGHLSDTGSAKNSGADADAESETDSESEESPEAAQSDVPSLIASGADNVSQTGTSLFAPKPSSAADNNAGGASGTSTRESTPGRSLFERVTKGDDGQDVRASEEPESAPTKKAAALPVDQTWNPSTTPIKFAPSSGASQAQPKSLFGTSTPSTGFAFGSKPAASSNLFGAATPKSAASVETTKETSAAAAPGQSDKSGGESDKENDSQATKPSIFGSSSTAPQPNAGSLFQAQPASTESSTKPEQSKATSNIFGAATKAGGNEQPKPASNIFGAANKPAEPSTAAPTQASTLFGAKPSESSTLFGSKSAETPAAATSSAPSSGFSFGGGSKEGSATPATASSLFGSKPATPAGNLFGNASTSSSSNLFGAAKPAGEGATPAPAAEASSSKPVPTFSFGGASSGADKPNGTPSLANKPLFGAPKSPPTTSSNSMFAGSPMKQDEASPAKKPFNASNASGTAAPVFSFGGTQNSSSNIFGGSSNTPSATAAPSAPGLSFGSGTPAANGGSGNAGFSFTSNASSGSSFNNPFSSGNGDNAQSAPQFNFGGSSGTTQSAPPSFQFGGSTPATSTSMFGNQSNNTSAPAFGGSSNGGGAASFSFTAGSAAAAPNTASMFGSNQAGNAQGFAASLQPPAGGASTTGTNTPFSLGGSSSLATTPAGGTPEPSSTATAAAAGAATAADGEAEDGEKHEQISLVDNVDENEDVLHEVRAKILKFVPADKDGDGTPKKKSPWSTQGVGALRLLKNTETNIVRLLLRAEPRGHIAINRAVLPKMEYKADEKYVKLTTSDEGGEGLETWMIQVKTKDLAKKLAADLEEHKKSNDK